MNLDLLADQIGPATRLQFALDGVWEDARTVGPGGSAPTAAALQPLIEGSDDFALEVFFGDVGFGETFIGVRMVRYPVDGKVDILRQLHRAMEVAPGGTSLFDVLGHLSTAIGGRLFEGPCDFLEIGVCNLWKRVGAHRIWNRGEPVEALSALSERLRNRAPQLLQVQPMPLIAECAVSQPVPHWIGLPVSRQEPGGHRLDLTAVAERLAYAAGPGSTSS